MTPSEVETAARYKYNASSDTFYTQVEILRYMTQACMELARHAYVIERTYTTTTTAGTQEYSFPTNTLAIKRVTYDGSKMYPINFREDDAVTLSNSSSTQTGRSLYYTIFNYTLALRPIPDTSALTLKVYSYSLPSDLAITSALEVPAIFHHDLIDFIVAQMAAKDQNYQAAAYYMQIWNDHVLQAKKLQRRMKRADSFATVQDENALPTTIIGAV